MVSAEAWDLTTAQLKLCCPGSFVLVCFKSVCVWVQYMCMVGYCSALNDTEHYTCLLMLHKCLLLSFTVSVSHLIICSLVREKEVEMIATHNRQKKTIHVAVNIVKVVTRWSVVSNSGKSYSVSCLLACLSVMSRLHLFLSFHAKYQFSTYHNILEIVPPQVFVTLFLDLFFFFCRFECFIVGSKSYLTLQF